MKRRILSKTQLVNFKNNFISLLLALIIMTAYTGAMAQSILDSPTQVGVAPGAPAGSYALSGMENVNLFSGKLNFTLPLLKTGGRGEAQSAVMLPIESNWTYFYFFRQQDGTFYNPTPMYNMHSLAGPNYGPGALLLKSEDIVRETCTWSEGGVDYVRELRQSRLRLTFTGSNGTEFELRDAIYGGAPLNYGTGYSAVPLCNVGAKPNRGRTFVTADGTAATFISDADVDTGQGTTKSTDLHGYLKMRDGTQYRIDNGLVSWIRDRNGNQTTYTYSNTTNQLTNRKLLSAKDSLGRETTIEYGVNDVAPYGLCDRITYRGTGGQKRIIRVSYSLLSNTLANGFTLKPKYQLFPPVNPNFDLPGLDTTTNFDTNVISSVWLPDDGVNTRRYRFFYNSYAELARAELPTGGAYEYDWETSPEMFYDTYQPEIVRRVKERRVINASNVEQKTTYTYAFPSDRSGNTGVTVDHFDGSQPTPRRISRSKHYFYGTPLPLSYLSLLGSLSLYNESAWNQGKEYQTDLFAADGATLLRSKTQVWRQRAPVSWWNCGSYCTQANAPINDPRIVETITTLADTGQVSKVTSIDPADSTGQTVGFDQFNNQTDVWEFDFGSGQPGAFKRRTHTDFVTDTNYISGTGAHLRSLPSQTWVSSDTAGNNKASLTQFEYDVYTGANHAQLLDRSNVIGHDTINYGISSLLKRGNVTKVLTYDNAQAQTGGVSVYSHYDILGNVVETIDAKGNHATISYNDNFGSANNEARTNSIPSYLNAQSITVYPLNGKSTFAFPTSDTNPSPFNWTAYTQFDYFTGQTVNTEDVNGVISKTIYNDDLDRPTQTVTAVGVTNHERQTTVNYYDDENRIETTSDLNALNDNLLKSESFYDGLGRTVKNHRYEADGSIVVTESDPFEMIQDPETSVLRAGSKVSNPYRLNSGEQIFWTKSLSDSLGRTVKVIAPDGAYVKTEYSGNAVTVTDPAGKQHRSITNALGWLTRVDEPNNSGSLGTISAPAQPTNYDYDVLNNLLQVQQNGTNEEQCGTGITSCAQTRTFAYDSLSRLRAATNPEMGTTPTTGTINYQYDNNGNLTKKTDARGVVADYTYDNLNRILTRVYSAPAGLTNYSATPAVNYYYDGAYLNALDQQQTATGSVKGQLTSVSSTASRTNYTAFDVMGRVTASEQRTPFLDTDTIATATARASAYKYNLAGSLIEQTYPSTRVVKNVLDADGDLSVVESKKKTDAGFWNYAQQFTYNASGAITSMQLGNGTWESTELNSRLQPTQIALGTLQNGTDKLKLNYTYKTSGQNDNNGNVLSQMITVPTVTIGGTTHNGFTATQNYTYDSLNRLKSATETISSQTWKQTYNYDRYGNRTFKAAETTTLGSCPAAQCNPTISPTNNRLTSAQGYNYDNAGNMKTDALSQQFTYDSENKQTEVKDQYGNSIGRYFYDGDGKRVKKKVGTETTIFIYDESGRLVEEYSNVVATAQYAQVSYLTTDHLGSPRITTNKDGGVVSRRDFMPFGEEITAAQTSQRKAELDYAGDNVRQKFTGYERDGETELDFAQARYYSKSLGRFYSVDPENYGASEDDPQSWNGYGYGRNNPILYSDPDGLEYRVCNNQGQCWTHGDGDFKTGQRQFGGLYQETDRDGHYDSGNILDSDGNVVGTYERTSIDREYQFVYGIAEQSVRKAKVVGALAAGAAAVGVCVGVPGACPAAARAAIRIGSKAFAAGKLASKLCFVEGTPILTENGLKPIEEIKEGDKVLSYNEKTKQTEYKTVVQTMVREAEAGRILSVKVEGEAEALGVTGEHPFYVRIHKARDNTASEDDEGEWIEAKDLQIGDEIRKADGSWAKVESVTQRSEGAKVYNFEVEDNHNYFVGRTNLLAHNDCKKYIQKAIRAAKPQKNGDGLEYTMKDGTKLVFRKDTGAAAHSIGKKYPNPVDHYNVEVHVPIRGRFEKTTNAHIILDVAGKVIDVIIK